MLTVYRLRAHTDSTHKSTSRITLDSRSSSSSSRRTLDAWSLTSGPSGPMVKDGNIVYLSVFIAGLDGLESLDVFIIADDQIEFYENQSIDSLQRIVKCSGDFHMKNHSKPKNKFSTIRFMRQYSFHHNVPSPTLHRCINNIMILPTWMSYIHRSIEHAVSLSTAGGLHCLNTMSQ